MSLVDLKKPVEGSWTASVGLDLEKLVDYEDSISPQHYELEKEAIFKQCWLNVGRVEQVPGVGSYFTRELAVCDTSIIVVRGKDRRIRAFHNMCRHRGNKLAWTDRPGEEVSGVCRQFSCKYHGWRYDLDGELVFVPQETDFSALDKNAFGLAEIHCDVWEGFIFVNLAQSPRQSLREFLGEMGAGLEGYPFHEMTQHYGYRAEVKANWKFLVDASIEFYHAPTLHGNQMPNRDLSQLEAREVRGLHYRVMGPHRVATSGGVGRQYLEVLGTNPIQSLMRADLMGPWDPSFEIDVEQFPTLNPTKADFWGIDDGHFFPNFVLMVWGRNWILTYHWWPTAVNSHIFEANAYFPPPKTASERLAQELTVATVKDFALQDINTVEATHTALNSRAATKFPLSDEEIMIRSFRNEARNWVKAYHS